MHAGWVTTTTIELSFLSGFLGLYAEIVLNDSIGIAICMPPLFALLVGLGTHLRTRDSILAVGLAFASFWGYTAGIAGIMLTIFAQQGTSVDVLSGSP